MSRLEDLKTYSILDTEPEEELDDLAQIASAIFDTPVSLISFIDDKRQWFKAKIGIESDENKIEETFCQYTLGKPNDILIIENPELDSRVKDNPRVTCDGGIKFYASAPLVSAIGNVLGTVCVVDYKKRVYDESKYHALDLISKKVMNYIETRKQMLQKNKEIEFSAERLKKLTDLAPGAIFKLSFNGDGDLKFVFISQGIRRIIPCLCPEDLKKEPRIILNYIEGGNVLYDLFKHSYNTLDQVEFEFKVILDDKTEKWCWIKANPERRSREEVVWYGNIQEITQKKIHLNTLEKMLFDISHVIRKPIANMLGIVTILKSPEISNSEKRELCDILYDETTNLDEFISRLNIEYYSLKDKLKTTWHEGS
ncbi:hypothetical protein MM213_01170 [Belliella sp. R4-6]|uniref:histidine kinase n=1 Tax=Belliella alkalica TaxID=1730871 RepID=A0ABS9V6N0_9BACT|nr:hypothetical protein [Belliella alkalica]MCH7412077.1 hypothetical protein [Belliella alkalica]